MSQKEEKKIHVRLDGELNRLLRIRCAELELTIQDFVIRLLEKNLRDESDSSNRKSSRGTMPRKKGKGGSKRGAS